jgi:hypothetical protein
MSLIALVAMCIILIVFMVMLLIRYVYLEVLLVVAPLAWMAWIFPGTSKHFSKWWDKFIKQVFFPAIAMFFIYLVVQIGGNISAGQNTTVINPQSTDSWLGKFLQGIGNGVIGTTLGSFINAAVIIGLMMGGLAMASSLSTEGSKLAATAVGKVRDGVQGYAVKQGKRRGRQAFNKVGAGFVQRLRTGQLGKLSGVPGLQTVGGRIGRAVQPHLDNKDLVDEAAKNVPKDSKIILQNLENEGMSLEDKFAHIAELQKQGLLAENTPVGNTIAKDFLDKHADTKMVKAKVDAATGRPIRDPKTGEFVIDTDKNAREINVGGDGTSRSYGQGKVAFDADRNFLSNKGIRDLRREVDQLTKDGEDATEVLTQLDAATKKFVTEDLLKGDGKKINVNKVFEKSDYYTQNLMKNMSQYATHLISGMLPGAKSGALKNIEESYQNAIITEGDVRSLGQLKDPKQREALPDNIKEKWNMRAVYGALAGNVLFAAAPEAEAATPPPNPGGGATP